MPRNGIHSCRSANCMAAVSGTKSMSINAATAISTLAMPSVAMRTWAWSFKPQTTNAPSNGKKVKKDRMGKPNESSSCIRIYQNMLESADDDPANHSTTR